MRLVRIYFQNQILTLKHQMVAFSAPPVTLNGLIPQKHPIYRQMQVMQEGQELHLHYNKSVSDQQYRELLSQYLDGNNREKIDVYLSELKTQQYIVLNNNLIGHDLI